MDIGWVGGNDISPFLKLLGALQRVDFDLAADAFGSLPPFQLNGFHPEFVEHVFRDPQSGVLHIHLDHNVAVPLMVAAVVLHAPPHIGRLRDLTLLVDFELRINAAHVLPADQADTRDSGPYGKVLPIGTRNLGAAQSAGKHGNLHFDFFCGAIPGFSGDLGKSRYALKSHFDARELDLSITNASLVPVTSVAVEQFPEFKTLVLEEMQGIGYELLDIGIVHFSERFSQIDQDRYVVFTTEAGLEKQVTQRDMSQGMFRAFSVLVQLNYYILSGKKGFVIIDDIGEGLDFARAKLLVALLIRKAIASGIQLIMSTNDSFIMNAVDIEHWAVIMREGHKISLFNYENSRDIFEEFKFTGLNNFDFYSSEFFRSGFVEGELGEELEDDPEDEKGDVEEGPAE